MKRLALAAMIALVVRSAVAAPIPLITGPQDVAGLQGTINNLINQINANAVVTNSSGGTVLSAGGSSGGSLTVPMVSNAVNLVSISGSISGYPPTIAVSGTDTNVNLQLATQGNGLVQFAGITMWQAVPGLAACPGAQGAQDLWNGQGNQTLSPSPIVTGFLTILDWKGKPHVIPTC